MVESTLEGVVIQTPDPTKYQGLDELQSRVLGNRGTVIPSSSEARKAPPNKIFLSEGRPEGAAFFPWAIFLLLFSRKDGIDANRPLSFLMFTLKR